MPNLGAAATPEKIERAQLAHDAALAIQLIDFLQQRFDRSQAIWHEPTSWTKTVAISCQIVEAYHHLALPHLTQHLEAPLKWLRELPPTRELTREDARSVRLYPSRFKTFALLHDFESESLKSDFRELASHFDKRSGMLSNLPTGLMHAELATLIWLDTLQHLENDDWNIAAYRARRGRALKSLPREFEHWLAGKSKNAARRNGNRLRLKDDGDASYAFEILTQANTFVRRPLARDQAREKLIAVVNQTRAIDPRNHAPLYCAIQLVTHFSEDAARAAAREYIQHVREWIEQHWSQELPLDFAALTLRLLAHTYGDALRAQIFEANWNYRQETKRQQQDDAAQREHQELERILRSTFEISIGETKTLSGSRSPNQVQRVRFGFKTTATTESGDHAWAEKDALRLIIKKGSVESLRRAIKSYQDLDPDLRRYFAQHTAPMSRLSDDPDAPWYLLMEDLGRTKPLSEILAELDQPRLIDSAREDLTRAARAVAEAFQALHRMQRRLNSNATTNHVERLYILPMTENIDYLCEPGNFPALKSFVDEGFEGNEAPHRRLTTSLLALKSFENKLLRPPVLTQIHGDAHSRNIMLTSDLRAAKFVDVETLGGGKDYLMDYALLLEDVAFYRALPPNDTRERIQVTDWQIRFAGMPGETKNAVRYPFFPHACEATLVFQHELMRRIKAFAQSIDDENWQARLWLAVARSLILLLERQTVSGRLGAQMAHSAERVIVGYAEAARLLNELTTFCEGKGRVALPDVPFSGKRGLLRDQETPQLVQRVKQIFGALPNVVLKNDSSAPAWINYSTANASQPFAQFRTSPKQGDVALHFFVPPEFLPDPARLVSDSSNGARRVLLNKINLTQSDALRDLIHAAYGWSLEGGS